MTLELNIGDLATEDRLVWPYEKKDIFSVKYRYHRAYSMTAPRVNHRFTSSATIPKLVWKGIWKLETPFKIRSFMWKALHRL